MLVLTRKVGETILIGDEVTVTILRVRWDVVRVGVRAPEKIPIDREEIRKRKLAKQLGSQSVASGEAILESELTPSDRLTSATPR
jgi:carbon storage regulator